MAAHIETVFLSKFVRELFHFSYFFSSSFYIYVSVKEENAKISSLTQPHFRFGLLNIYKFCFLADSIWHGVEMTDHML